jgi:4-amino-4-deoxy-L-arabinose transferase-like glycosyltransferase
VTPAHRSSTDRALLAGSAALALFAVVTRLHNVAAYPAMYDWDGSGHAVNVVDLLEMHWPNPRSWCGSHPPLFYALSALFSVLLPESVPIHVTMRLLSAAAWVATVALVWRSLGRLGNTVDAAVAGAVLLGVPGLTIASCMVTNDALCALFVTATLVRLLETPRDGVPDMGHVALTATLAGLAAATKATGVAAIGIAAAFYAWRARHDPRRGLRALVVLGLASAAIAGPHYARLFVSLSGSPYDVLAVRAGSQEKEAIATLVHTIAGANTHSSFAALFHTALWGDPTAVFLPRGLETHVLARAVWAGGLIVTSVAVAGVVRVLVHRELLSRFAVVLLFGVSFAAALVPHAVDRPYIVLTKTNYMLPEALPVGILLALGLDGVRDRARTALRVALLAVAAGGVGLTVYGWWDTAPAVPQSTASRTPAASPALRVVARYFEYRARDPIRALRLLAPQVQLAHDLRLVRILGLPPLAPEPGLAPEDERSLELARARVAWLELYNLVRWMQPIAAALDVGVLEVSERNDTADVHVRIGAIGTTPPPGGDIGLWPFPSFEQRFTLERGDDGWRITKIDQTSVANENAVEAFVARPTMTAFAQLRALGWHPPWERAVASVLRESPD